MVFLLDFEQIETLVAAQNIRKTVLIRTEKIFWNATKVKQRLQKDPNVIQARLVYCETVLYKKP